MTPSPQRGRAIAMLALSCAAWGLSFPGGKVFMAALEQELPGRNSWLFSALTIGGRFAFAAVILWVLSRARCGNSRRASGGRRSASA